MRAEPSKPWFAPKRYGYGAGLPIAWQGWAVLAAYILILSVSAFVLIAIFPDPAVFAVGYLAFCAVATVGLGVICSRKTKGGWRWRNGETD